jgi:hypothetical protein
MRNVGMKKSRRKHPDLVACPDAADVKFVFPEEPDVVKTHVTDDDIKRNDGKQYDVHEFYISVKVTHAAFC